MSFNSTAPTWSVSGRKASSRATFRRRSRNIRTIQIQFALSPLTPAPDQKLLKVPSKAEKPPAPPGAAPPAVPADASKRSGTAPWAATEKAAKTPEFLRSKDARSGESDTGRGTERGGEKAAAKAKTAPPGTTDKTGEPTAESPSPPRPWLPLGVALCTSLGANVYFFWMWMEVRGRYRRLVQRRGGREETGEVE